MKTKSEITQQTALKTHLTPQQVRFVRLLEMSGTEFEDAVRNELDENPALEAVDTDVQRGETETEEQRFGESSEQLQAADYADTDDTPSYLLHARNDSADSRAHNFDYATEQQREWPSLVESLNEQLDMVDAPPRDIALARYLVGCLDDNGRLARSINDIIDDIETTTGTRLSRADLLPALDIIRYQLDPPGLGAVDLRQCLLIQIQRRQPKTLALRAAQEIIEDYFDVFVKKHFDRLESALGVDRHVLDEALAIIRQLDPKPGNGLTGGSSDKASHITPDFYVSPVEGEPGRFSVSLNQHIPELAVEQSFAVDTEDKAARMFIRRKREEANTFIGLMKRRSDTLMAVMTAIVKIQRRFFETEDTADLRPMILNDISESTGLDKSVISRATSNKYVATPGGVFPLKMFFNDTPTDDADTSSPEIVAALREIIEAEDKHRPLSDRALTEALNARGYSLARRTVTKYREKNKIPVARLRKEF